MPQEAGLLANLLITGGDNTAAFPLITCQFSSIVYAQELLVALPTQVPKQLTYINVSKQRKIANKISSFQR